MLYGSASRIKNYKFEILSYEPLATNLTTVYEVYTVPSEMDENTESNKPKSDRMREFRQQFKQKEKDLWPLKSKLRRLGAYEVLALVVKAGGVDMKSFCGTEAELAYAIEMLYANDGRDFDPIPIISPACSATLGKIMQCMHEEFTTGTAFTMKLQHVLANSGHHQFPMEMPKSQSWMHFKRVQ